MKKQNKFTLRHSFLHLPVMTVIVLTMVCSNAMAQDRDPFLPYTWSAPAATSSDAGSKSMVAVNPLVDKPISSYTVIGVAISPNDALAVLKSRDKHEYFAYVGDPVGSEGGVLETIDTTGITVNISGKIMPLKVSNRFEMQDEKTDEKKDEKK